MKKKHIITFVYIATALYCSSPAEAARQLIVRNETSQRIEVLYNGRSEDQKNSAISSGVNIPPNSSHPLWTMFDIAGWRLQEIDWYSDPKPTTYWALNETDIKNNTDQTSNDTITIFEAGTYKTSKGTFQAQQKAKPKLP